VGDKKAYPTLHGTVNQKTPFHTVAVRSIWRNGKGRCEKGDVRCEGIKKEEAPRPSGEELHILS